MYECVHTEYGDNDTDSYAKRKDIYTHAHISIDMALSIAKQKLTHQFGQFEYIRAQTLVLMLATAPAAVVVVVATAVTELCDIVTCFCAFSQHQITHRHKQNV